METSSTEDFSTQQNNTNQCVDQNNDQQQPLPDSRKDYFQYQYFTSDVKSVNELIEKLDQLILESKRGSSSSSSLTTLRDSFERFLLEMCWKLYYGSSSNQNNHFHFDVNELINVLTSTRKNTAVKLRGDDNGSVGGEPMETEEGENEEDSIHDDWPFVDASLLFLDVISIFDCQHLLSANSDEETDESVHLSDITVSLIKQLLIHKFITLNEMKIYLSTNSLGHSDLFPSSFNDKKFVILKTRLFYQQKRYNLFNEETEGYSKLITELLSVPSSTKKEIEQLKERVQSLIGYFDLDPNRVFDLVMDTAEIFLHNLNFMDLLSLFNRSNIGHILGFKFRFYHGVKTPARLFKCAALLIKNQELRLMNLYPHLYPENDNDVKNKLFDFEQEKFQEANQVGVVNLNQDTSQEEAQKATEPRNDVQIPSIFENNQKIGLLAALLKVGACTDAINMLDSLSTPSVPFSFHPSVSSALSDALTILIDPIYEKMAPSRISDTNYDSNEKFECSQKDAQLLSDVVFPLLYHLGPELHHSLVLFTKLVRVVNEYIFYQRQSTHDSVKPEYLSVLEIFLSALCFIPLNTGLVYEIWSILAKMNFENRFSVYFMTKDNGYTNNYKMVAQYNLASKDIKALLKRLSKENTKTRGRAIARIAHSNPIVVAEKICEICENYENLIPVIVDALRYVTPLFHDVMTFCIIQRLIKEPVRPKLKDDASSIASWLANLATLLGYLFKKYTSTDLEPIINYVLNQIKGGGWEDLIILKELIQHMSGIEIIDDSIGLQQLYAHAGGEVLRTECGGFTSIASRTFKRSINKLKESFLDSGKGKMLLLLTAKLCSSIYSLHDEADMPDAYLKLVMESKDKCHEVFMLILRFIERNIPIFIEEDNLDVSQTPNKALKCISVPTVQKMISFGIDSELAYSIVRKTLGYVPSQSGFDESLVDSAIDKKVGDISESISKDEILWQIIPKDLYNAFWSLSIYDIFVPVQTYNDKLQEIAHECEAAKIASSQQGKRKELEKLETTAARLREEMQAQNENHQRVLELIRAKKDKFFQGFDENLVHREFMTYFCQYCIIPRLTMSSTDALYCAKFLELVHSEELPMFNTVEYLSVVLSRLVPSYLVCATEQESRRLATLLLSSFIMIEKWISSEDQFKQQCDKIGFKRDSTTNDRVNFKEFTSKILPSIHTACTNKFVFYLTSGQHNYTRNCLIVGLILGNAAVFPKYKRHALELLAPVEKLKDDAYDDINSPAKRYYSILADLEKKLQEEPAPPPIPSAPQIVSKATPLAPEITKEDTKSLNPEAVPFYPTPPTSQPSEPRVKGETNEQPPPPPPKQEQSAADELRKKLQESILQKDTKEKKKDTRRESKGEGDMRRDRSKRGRDSMEGDNAPRDSRRDNRDSRDNRDNRDTRDTRDSRDSRDGRDNRDRTKDFQKPQTERSDRDRKSDDRRSGGRDNRDNREFRDNRDSSRDSRGTKRDRDNQQDNPSSSSGSKDSSRDSKRRRDDQDMSSRESRDDTHASSSSYNNDSSGSKKDRKRIRRPEIK